VDYNEFTVIRDWTAIMTYCVLKLLYARGGRSKDRAPL